MICKFDERDGQKYKPVWIAIKSLAESALTGGDNSVSEITQRDGGWLDLIRAANF